MEVILVQKLWPVHLVYHLPVLLLPVPFLLSPFLRLNLWTTLKLYKN